MKKFILLRILQIPLVLFFLITVSFFMIRFTPGGPFSSERNLDPVVEKALQEKFHLNQPLHRQYLHFLADLLRGDLGPSFKHKSRSVNEIIAERLPHSMVLGSYALLLALLVGISAGILAAVGHNTTVDYSCMTLAMLGLSLPPFVIGPLLQLLFAIYLGWLPLAGTASQLYLILPALTLAMPFAARIARLTRAGMLEVMHQDYIRTARAKGLPEHVVILRHALRGGLLPVVNYLGPAIAMITTGSLVAE